jgi:hypothetical protein
MEQAEEEQGISPKTMNRAKSALGVISVKHGNQWYWEIPIEVVYTEVSQDGQDGQHGQESQGCQHGQGNQHSQDDVAQAGHGETMTSLTTLTNFNGMEGK